MNRDEKEVLVNEMRKNLLDSEFIAIARNGGVTVAHMTTFRAQIKGAGASYRVAKNTLMRLAVKGTDAEKLESFFDGPTGIAYGKEPVAVAKAMVDFAKGNDKFSILGALFEGRVLKYSEVEALSKIPSLPVLYAQIAGSINGLATKLAVLAKAISEKETN